MTASPFRLNHPRPVEPGRVMTHMLVMATFQLCHPILHVILMIIHDLALHSVLTRDGWCYRELSLAGRWVWRNAATA